MADQLNPAPDISESRLMMSPFSARQLYYNPSADVRTNLMLNRVVFLADCNFAGRTAKSGWFLLAEFK